jgi:hypothetical protein
VLTYARYAPPFSLPFLSLTSLPLTLLAALLCSAATTAVLKEQSKSPDAPKDTHHLSPSDSGTLKRSRSTSAPPLMAPPGVLRAQQHNHHPAGGKGLAETDDDDEEENDPYADQTDEDDEDDRLHHQHGGGLKEKEAEPYGRKTITSVSFAHMPGNCAPCSADFSFIYLFI